MIAQNAERADQPYQTECVQAFGEWAETCHQLADATPEERQVAITSFRAGWAEALRFVDCLTVGAAIARDLLGGVSASGAGAPRDGGSDSASC